MEILVPVLTLKGLYEAMLYLTMMIRIVVTTWEEETAMNCY